MDPKREFAKQVCKARAKKGFTQEQLAEKADISARWYQRIEYGERLPGAAVMLKLILLLDLDVECFRAVLNL